MRNMLRNVNKLSLWGAAIRVVVDGKPTADDIDNLILELRSQSKDNPKIMAEILGRTIYDIIIRS